MLAIETLGQDIELHCEAICFHAQQAAEKLVKSMFTENGLEPSRTYDVAFLLSQAEEFGWIDVPEDIVRSAARLTGFAVMARYEFSRDITGEEAQLSVKDCNAIAKAIEEAGYKSLLIELPGS